jgi:succinate-semialdehyde dehydrogenase/glutarate-semialdehyde dehydrogenase
MNIAPYALQGSASFVGNEYVTTHHSLIPEQHFTVFNPITHEAIVHLHSASAQDVESALRLASQAVIKHPLSLSQRQSLLIKSANLIEQHIDALAQLLSNEAGKTISDAKAEIHYGISYLRYYSQASKILAEAQQHEGFIVEQRPVGVVSAITPWNFPNAMILRKASIALAAGCPFIVKPSEFTPLSALAIAELLAQAGWPEGWFAVLVSEHAKEVGHTLTSDSRIAKFTFTGSTAVGKALNMQCAQHLKRVSLELGGNAPFMVMHDADIDLAVSELVKNKMRNVGQVCVAANRIYVAEAVYEDFADKLCKALAQLKTGEPQDPETQVGSMIHSKAASKIAALVEHAEAQGAVRLSGKAYQAGSAYHDHTVLSNVQHDDDICQQEIFGPVYPLIRVSSDNIDDWLKYANDTTAGLVAYAFSTHSKTLNQLCNGLRFGMLGLNTGIISNAAAPFGGIKQSGFGREGGEHGLLDYTAPYYIKQA